MTDESGWLEYKHRLENDRAALRMRLKRKAARDKPCPRCGEMCRDAPHFKVGFSPAVRRAASACSGSRR